jgi:hypothetical protein
VSLIVFAFPLACIAEGLAGVTACDDINRLNVSPIDLGDIAKVGHAWVMGFHHLDGGWLNLGIPSKVATNGHV